MMVTPVRYARASLVALLISSLAMGMARSVTPALSATPTVTISEFPCSFCSSPVSITAGPDNNVWFGNQTVGSVGSITTSGSLSGPFGPYGADGIVTGPDKNLWLATGDHQLIVAMSPTGTIVHSYPVQSTPYGIAVGPIPPGGGTPSLWFTDLTGNQIGEITTDGQLTKYPQGSTLNSQPQEITLGPDGNLWFTRIGAIGRITPAGVLTEFTQGITGTGLFGITGGPDGNLWFTEERAVIGRITPSGVVTEFSSGFNSGAATEGITAGPDGNLWFTDLGTTAAIGMITTSGVVTETSAAAPPSGLSANSEPVGITVGPDGNLWFTESRANQIGRFAPPPAAACSTTPASSGDADVFAADICRFTQAEANVSNQAVAILGALSTLPQVQIGATDVYSVPASGTLSLAQAVIAESATQLLTSAVDDASAAIGDAIAKGVFEKIMGGPVPCAVEAAKELGDAAQSDAQAASEFANAGQTLNGVTSGLTDGTTAQALTGSADQGAKDLLDKYKSLQDAFSKEAMGCFITQGEHDALLRAQFQLAADAILADENNLQGAYNKMGYIAQGGFVVLGPVGTGSGLPVLSDPALGSSLQLAQFPPALSGNTNVTVNIAPQPPLNIPANIPTNVIAAGNTLTVTGGPALNLPPSAQGIVALGSTPVRLARFMTDSTGGFSTSVVIPALTPPGTHELYVVVAAADGTFHVLAAMITVTDTDLAIGAGVSPPAVQATSSAGAAVSFAVPTASDEEGPVSVTCDHASGSTFPVGSTTVTCEATDADDSPSTAQTTLTVTVTDTDLAITAGVNPVAVQATSTSGAAVTFAVPTASDEDGPVSVTCDRASGSTFPVGSTTVTCKATDADDSPTTARTTLTVTVTDAPLTITGISALAFRLDAFAGVTFKDADPNGKLAQYSAVIDWGDRSTPSAAAVVRNPFAGGFAAGGSHDYSTPGTYTITVTVKDVQGATTSRSMTVTVQR